MTDLTDRNTVAAVSQGHDRVSSMLQHFSYVGASWTDFGKVESYLEMLKMDLVTLLHCVEANLQETYQTHDPVDFGT